MPCRERASAAELARGYLDDAKVGRLVAGFNDDGFAVRSGRSTAMYHPPPD